MKVLMIAPQPFFQPRGTPISVYQRLEGLSSLGHDVDLITYHIGEDVDIPRVSIHRAPKIPFIKNVKIGPSWPKLLLDFALCCKAFAMLTTTRYDAIHSHEEASFFSAFFAALFRKRHLYDMHSILPRQLENFDVGNYGPIVKLFEMLEKRVINTCDALITIGEDIEAYAKQINPGVKQIMIENMAVNANGGTSIQHSADELKERIGLKNRVSIVYTGTFERYQGLDLLLESAKLVKEQCPEVSFVLVGGQPDQIENWRSEAKKNDLEDCTLFTGTVSPWEALTYLEMADILVSPRTEGLSVPLKIYSYLYSGRPTVATTIVAHTQILNDDISVLVSPDKQEFAQGILNLIRDPGLRERIGRQAQEYAQERYSSANYLTKLDQIYQMLQPPALSSGQQSSSPKELIGS